MNTKTFNCFTVIAMTRKPLPINKRGGMYDRHHFIEEPYARKLASTVLETGGVGDDLAEFNRRRLAHAE